LNEDPTEFEAEKELKQAQKEEKLASNAVQRA
jgi:hypothetical protein